MSRISSLSYNETWKNRSYYAATGQNTSVTSGTAGSFSTSTTRSDIVRSPTPRPSPLKTLAYGVTADERRALNGYVRYAIALNPDGSDNQLREQSGNLDPLVTPISVPNAVINTALRAKCTGKVLNKIKNSQLNVPLAYAEAGRTAALIGDTARRITRGIIDLRRGNFADAARALLSFPRRANGKPPVNEEEAFKRWLELQYGWKPLLQDVYGAASDFARNNNESPNRFTRKVSAYVESRSRSTRILSTGPTAYEVTDLKRDFCKMTLLIKQSNPTLANAAAQGWSNPASLAWELLPFSFVADWFVPIGDYLGTLDAPLGWDLYDGCQTEVSESLTVRPRWLGTHSNYRAGSIRPGCGGRKYVFSRTALSSFPTASFPRIKNPVSMGHMANAIALLRGLF